MFYYIEGTLSLIDGMVAVIDCGGVGYALNTTANTLGRIRLGEKTRLYVFTVVREDCFDLYGFATREEKAAFELLIGVSGVGPKVALAILSSNTPEALSIAIVSGNERALTGVPGVGKRIAQRVIMELKDKLGTGLNGSDFSIPAAPGGAPIVGKDKLADAAAALGVLGYGSSEIASALKGINIQELSVEEIIKKALRSMAVK